MNAASDRRVVKATVNILLVQGYASERIIPSQNRWSILKEPFTVYLDLHAKELLTSSSICRGFTRGGLRPLNGDNHIKGGYIYLGSFFLQPVFPGLPTSRPHGLSSIHLDHVSLDLQSSRLSENRNPTISLHNWWRIWCCSRSSPAGGTSTST